ncbi:hypothetical protein [Glaciibacter sp. 2TAF33]|uniref:hypothetical protein n=1 Tax=Glaciibacter sp. 2TAF33 TaxID=3233015 RepID=UPI003F8FEAFC
MATRWARFMRGWVAAAFSTFVAALSHTLGGGAAPGALAVIVSLAFAGMVCVGLSGRTLSAWRVAASVILSQLIFHGLFSLGAPGGALTTDASTGAPLAAHHHTALAITHGVTGSMEGHGASHVGAGMWIAHGAAAVLTIVALRHGEAAFWGMLTTARLVIRRIVTVAAAITPAVPTRRTPSTGLVFVPREPALVFSVMRHRGPPVSAGA